MKFNGNIKSKMTDGAILLIALLAAAVCIFPVLHCIALSFSGAAAADAGYVTIWPKDVQLTAYKSCCRRKPFLQHSGYP